MNLKKVDLLERPFVQIGLDFAAAGSVVCYGRLCWPLH